MKHPFIILSVFLLLFSFTGFAHSGIGLVQDSKGALYYTDLKQVWKITPDGKRTLAVPNVNTHLLFVDSNDNVYGENVFYEGKESRQLQHSLWVLRPDGKTETVIGPKPVLSTHDYSLIRDSTGNQYWVQSFHLSRFMKETPEGKVTQLAEGFYNNLKWLYATASGSLYFINGDNLYKVDSNNLIRPLARNLSEISDSFAFASPDNSILGIWSDKKNNIYIAVYSGQVVKKISPVGTVSIVDKSEGNWSPVSGLFDKDGSLWLLEYNTRNEARVRKIEKFTGSSKGGTTRQKILLTTAIVLGLVFAFIIVRTSMRRH